MSTFNLSNTVLKVLLCFIAVSCNTHSKTQPSLAKTEPQKIQTPPQTKLETDYIKTIVRDTCTLGKNKDPSIQLVKSNDQKIAFSTIIFNDIPGEGPYRVEQRRLLQNDPNLFYQADDAQKTLNTIKELNVPFGILLPQNAYLPGERATWRIVSRDGKVLKEMTCCPNPRIMKNSSDQRIMEASLLSVNRPDTVYMLFFPPMKEQRKFIFTSGHKQSRGIIPPEKLETTTFAPGIDGSTGGIAKIEIQIQNESYVLELPWGTKLQATQSLEGLETSYLVDLKNSN